MFDPIRLKTIGLKLMEHKPIRLKKPMDLKLMGLNSIVLMSIGLTFFSSNHIRFCEAQECYHSEHTHGL